MSFRKADAEQLLKIKRQLHELRKEHDELSRRAKAALLEAGKSFRRAGRTFELVECKSPSWRLAYLEACGEEAAERVKEDAPVSYRLQITN